LPHALTLPTSVTAGDVVAVAAGVQHTLLLTQYGHLYAFGVNTYGQLGDGTTADRHVPVRVLTG